MKTALLLLACISFAYAQNCATGSNTTCDACTAIQGCGWCAASKVCSPGSNQGPTDGSSCVISWEFPHCTDCKDKGTTCSSCLAHPECGWCGAKNLCVRGDLTNVPGCSFLSHTCSCSDYTNCGQCLAATTATGDSACQYCEGVCQDAGATCPFLTPHTCGSNSDICSKFSFDCEACLNEGCQMCEGPALDADSNDGLLGDGMGPTATFCISSQKTCQAPLLAKHNCADVCRSYDNCDTCQLDNSCGWCVHSGKEGGTAKCVLREQMIYETCMVAHDCPDQIHCSHGSYFVGGMFFVILSALATVAGYAFWRWRQGKPIYTRIN